MRYIEDNHAGDKSVYVIAVLENFSRAVLARLLTPRQDLTTYLTVGPRMPSLRADPSVGDAVIGAMLAGVTVGAFVG